jgi:hypothetical protein
MKNFDNLNSADIAEEVKKMLMVYYGIRPKDLPGQAPKSRWKKCNRLGFLLGIVMFGESFHIRNLYKVLVQGEFQGREDVVIDRYYDYYVRPFKNNDICLDRHIFPDDLYSDVNMQQFEKDTEPTHKDMQVALLKRDKNCVFCWIGAAETVAHIMAEACDYKIPSNQRLSVICRGVENFHHPENGLLLCRDCLDHFDTLQYYVDSIDQQLVVKVINIYDQYSRQDEDAADHLKNIRKTAKENFTDGRRAIEANGEMAINLNESSQVPPPNRKSLYLHKTACLIWNMAGGAEEEYEEQCSREHFYEEDVYLDYYKTKNIQDWVITSATIILDADKRIAD